MDTKTKTHLSHEEMIQKMREDLDMLLKEQPELNTAFHIERFLIAREYNFEKAKLMFKNYLEFRLQKGITRIEGIDMNSEKWKKIYDYYSEGHYGIDNQGRLIVIERVGYYDTKSLIKEFSISELEDFIIQQQERILFVEFPILSEFSKKKIDKAFVILDLKKLKIKSLFEKEFKLFMKKVLSMTSDYYPETLAKCVFINAPFGAEWAWSIIKLWMDPKISAKFEMFTDNGKAYLSKHMNFNDLPKEIGGENNISLTYGYGPSNEELKKSFLRKSLYLQDRSLEYKWFYNDEERKRFFKETPSTLSFTKDSKNIEKSNLTFEPTNSMNLSLSFSRVKIGQIRPAFTTSNSFVKFTNK